MFVKKNLNDGQLAASLFWRNSKAQLLTKNGENFFQGICSSTVFFYRFLLQMTFSTKLPASLIGVHLPQCKLPTVETLSLPLFLEQLLHIARDKRLWIHNDGFALFAFCALGLFILSFLMKIMKKLFWDFVDRM